MGKEDTKLFFCDFGRLEKMNLLVLDGHDIVHEGEREEYVLRESMDPPSIETWDSRVVGFLSWMA